jgi:hypothetical protein
VNGAEATERTPRLGDLVWYLIGVAGLAACITLVFLGMRAVMAIGGACADGGPYVPVQRCPEGVGAAMALAFPGMFLFGGVMLFRGAALGEGFAAAVMLAWPALFLSLGWNFLEFAFAPSAGGDVELGWLVCGVLFVLMGGLPLLGLLGTLRRGNEPGPAATVDGRAGYGAWTPHSGAPAEAGVTPRAPRKRLAASGPVRRAELARIGVALRALAAARRLDPAEAAGATTGTNAVPSDLITQLERLAALHERGQLTDDEFRLAKRRLIAPGTEGR